MKCFQSNKQQARNKQDNNNDDKHKKWYHSSKSDKGHTESVASTGGEGGNSVKTKVNKI